MAVFIDGYGDPLIVGMQIDSDLYNKMLPLFSSIAVQWESLDPPRHTPNGCQRIVVACDEMRELNRVHDLFPPFANSTYSRIGLNSTPGNEHNGR